MNLPPAWPPKPPLLAQIARGAKSYVFERKLQRQTIRRTSGDVRAWTIEEARAEARRLAVVLDNGQDPREIER